MTQGVEWAGTTARHTRVYGQYSSFDQFVTRRDTLLVNASGAVGDCYIAWRLWRLPEGSLCYDADIQHSYAFRPTR